MRWSLRDIPHPWLLVAALLLIATGIGIWLAAWEEPAPLPQSRPGVPPPPRALTDLDLPLTKIRPFASPPRIARLPVRNHGKRPAGIRPYAIVLHGTGSGAPGSSDYGLARLREIFNDPDREVSAHYGIDRRGRIARFVPDERRAWHVAAAGWNDVSIGIELINDNSGVDPFPPAQMAALQRLVRWLATRHDIPLEYVYHHRVLQPWDRSDPAGNFPDIGFRARIGGGPYRPATGDNQNLS